MQPRTDQTSFFGGLIYDRIFQKRSHWLKDLLQVVDFGFINDLCQYLYNASTTMIHNMGIDHSGSHIVVPQKFLDCSNVIATSEQMRGE